MHRRVTSAAKLLIWISQMSALPSLLVACELQFKGLKVQCNPADMKSTTLPASGGNFNSEIYGRLSPPTFNIIYDTWLKISSNERV